MEGRALVPTPQMPAGWEVVEDLQLHPSTVEQIGSKMDAELLGVRNTVYEVRGLRIKVNTLIAASPEDAEKVMDFFLSIKPKGGSLQRGTTIYEFVGNNEVNHLARQGRLHLEQQSD